MEYAVPFEKGPDALRELVSAIRTQRINTGFPIEYRSVAADDVSISPFEGRESATIAVHQFHTVDTTRLFALAESIFARYAGRPHWGKRHTKARADFERLYSRFDKFRELRSRLDPTGKFLNEHLHTIFN